MSFSEGQFQFIRSTIFITTVHDAAD